MSARVERIGATAWRAAGRPPVLGALERALAVAVEGLVDVSTCHAWAKRIRAARSEWTADFGGEQFALGRAFYTHFETGRSEAYFGGVEASDAVVEAHLPGMQALMLDTLAAMAGGIVRRRPGFCGPGVHIFPAGEKVAREGGVVHFDVEGLSPLQLERRARALTLVLSIQNAGAGGGLRLWEARYRGTEEVTEADLATPSATHRYLTGTALLLESYRLHQIQPFRGARHRVSATVHAVEVDANVWEAWF